MPLQNNSIKVFPALIRNKNGMQYLVIRLLVINTGDSYILTGIYNKPTHTFHPTLSQIVSITTVTVSMLHSNSMGKNNLHSPVKEMHCEYIKVFLQFALQYGIKIDAAIPHYNTEQNSNYDPILNAINSVIKHKASHNIHNNPIIAQDDDVVFIPNSELKEKNSLADQVLKLIAQNQNSDITNNINGNTATDTAPSIKSIDINNMLKHKKKDSSSYNKSTNVLKEEQCSSQKDEKTIQKQYCRLMDSFPVDVDLYVTSLNVKIKIEISGITFASTRTVSATITEQKAQELLDNFFKTISEPPTVMYLPIYEHYIRQLHEALVVLMYKLNSETQYNQQEVYNFEQKILRMIMQSNTLESDTNGDQDHSNQISNSNNINVRHENTQLIKQQPPITINILVVKHNTINIQLESLTGGKQLIFKVPLPESIEHSDISLIIKCFCSIMSAQQLKSMTTVQHYQKQFKMAMENLILQMQGLGVKLNFQSIKAKLDTSINKFFIQIPLNNDHNNFDSLNTNTNTEERIEQINRMDPKYGNNNNNNLNDENINNDDDSHSSISTSYINSNINNNGSAETDVLQENIIKTVGEVSSSYNIM